MDTRLSPELDYWHREVDKYAGQDYATIRASNLSGLLTWWPEIPDLRGCGLDVGCSPVSVFEQSGLDMYAVDPLMEEYQKLYKPEKPTVKYVLGHKDDGKLQFHDKIFDFVFCINVIDHTPHYQSLIAEIARVLEPTGLLYFMVNFDKVLMPPNHVKLWSQSVVTEELSGFFLLKGVTVWNEQYQKYMYWGKYKNGGER